MAAISFAGRLAGDSETRYTPNGAINVALKVPVDTGWGDRKQTTWYRVTAWGKLAERLDAAAQKGYLEKGTNVFVRGVFSLREYDKNDGTKGYSPDVTADDVSIIFPPRDTARQNEDTPTYDSPLADAPF